MSDSPRGTVERTLRREPHRHPKSIKQLEEKGLVVVAQGRGTHVTGVPSWSMLDPVVLSALIDNEASVGNLDELTVVRAVLESAMAGEVAGRYRVRKPEGAMRAMLAEHATIYQAIAKGHVTEAEQAMGTTSRPDGSGAGSPRVATARTKNEDFESGVRRRQSRSCPINR